MILIFIGSRANYGRLKILIDLMIEDGLDFGIVIGSYDIPEKYQAYIVHKIDNLLHKDSACNTVTSASLVAMGVTNYISNCSRLPKLAIVHGDRTENLGFAMAMSYNNIKLLHTEGGEVSGNIDNKVRFAISSLADIHCVTTQSAYRNLARYPSYSSYIVGSTAVDHAACVGRSKERNNEVLVLYNPCPEDDFDEFVAAIAFISITHKIRWVNPNVDPGHRLLCKKIHATNVEFTKNLDPMGLYRLMSESRLMIGNSSSGIKEGAYLELPYILVGNRQNKREVDLNVFRAQCSRKSILEEFKFITLRKPKFKYRKKFGDGNASKKILKLIKEKFL